ncbi:MAG: hypothetical protein D6814_17280 [Calditrichaeota bacterium]|nr:MAG: hypothetical protein D6814_17280 [Calditrichota bacterium]
MNCDLAKTYYMDFIYENLEGELQSEFKKHLATCKACQEEIAHLQSTRQLLQALPEEEPDSPLVFAVPQRRSLANWWQEFASLLPRPIWARALLGLASLAFVLLVAGSVANLNISYDHGQFRLSMHLLPPRQTEISDEAAQALLAQMRTETTALITNMHAAERAEQQQMLSQVVDAFARDIQALERKQENDLMLIGQGLQEIHRSTASQFGETNQVLQQLVQHISVRQ